MTHSELVGELIIVSKVFLEIVKIYGGRVCVEVNKLVCTKITDAYAIIRVILPLWHISTRTFSIVKHTHKTSTITQSLQ